ncbi:MAG TPA: adenylate/guanylate cyclase domain-containing protein [Acidimicrobiales bacterium]|nr:adenylate/guanylate cyclase domain-containing protein [Acidimicrobiales bacterium]
MADDPGKAPPEIRISDQDRERAVTRLRHHAADGSLTLEEFTDRVGTALSARTRGELDSVLSDLAPEPSPESRRDRTRRWVVGVMGGGRAKGRWRVGGSVTALAVMGSCELDFRRAEIRSDEVRVTAIAFMGGIDILVPEGIAVELTGLPIMGGKHLKVADVPFLPGAPVISVRAFPIMGGVSVRSKSERTRSDPAEPERLESPVDLSEKNEVALAPSSVASPTPREGTVTIMFSDIAGYSSITERVGDIAAHQLLRSHNVIVREQVTNHGGDEIKSQGDGFMVAFPSATQALRCAIAIQLAFEKYSVNHPDEPIQVHVGLHTGEPVRDGTDLLGRTVITASRLTDIARPGEILVSSLLHDLTESAGEFRFGDRRQVELKGITAPQTVYSVKWDS